MTPSPSPAALPDPLALIDAEAARSSSVLAATDPAAPVPTCPDWTALDLLWHVTEVHEFWASVLATEARTDEDAEKADGKKDPRPEGEDAREQLVERRARATASLLAQLEKRPDDQAAWTWFPADQSVGFTRRMQVHEATMHRVDAELTAGAETLSPISEEVAADGLDHAVAVMFAAGHDWIPEWAELSPLALLRLLPEGGEALDVEIAHWTGTRPRDGQEFDHLVARPLPEDADPDALPFAQAEGTALAIYLWLWGRSPGLDRLHGGAQQVELSGDEDAVPHVIDLLAQGMD